MKYKYKIKTSDINKQIDIIEKKHKLKFAQLQRQSVISAMQNGVVVITGGPGTGKSFFMRMIADEAEKKGKKVIYYYCSSDQGSLDGITVDGKIAILDGTAPHDADATVPAAAEDIIDLGAFWDSAILAKSRKRIELLHSEK